MPSVHDRCDPGDRAERCPFWWAHDEPDRPFDVNVLLCACIDCRAAIAAEARRTPRRVLCIKTNFDRILVSAEYLSSVLATDPDLEALLYVRGDWVRDLFVPADGFLSPSRRWWSTVCHEDEAAEDRRHLARRVAIHQSRRSRQRRDAGARAEAAGQSPPPVVRLVPLSEAVAPARRQHHRLIAAAAVWALASGVSLPTDLVAYICAAATAACSADRWPVTWWNRARVVHLLTCDLTNWSSAHRCLRPHGEAEALWRFLEFLADSGRLDRDSDPLAELRKPLLCMGGLGADGNPNATGERVIDCECYRTYRGPTHGDLEE